MTDTKMMKARFWMDVYLATLKDLGAAHSELAVGVADFAVKKLESRIGAES